MAMVVVHNVAFQLIRDVQAGVWDLGVHDFDKTPEVSWLTLIPIVYAALAVATKVSLEWTATELDLPYLGALCPLRGR